ncbi:MAG TPA: NADH-quinone oxidoreductase subunit J, partial [Vicinamibacterales bacterium]|nr:NADH-quinone oxidoreductase subunit J [Vicinamibacterales bacterium]
MLESVMFYALAAFILGFGVLVVTARNTVHCVLFLVANFLCVAMVYVMLGAEFLAIIQILVYAGGIVVLYLFVVMLVNLRRPPDAPVDTRRQSVVGFALAGA